MGRGRGQLSTNPLPISPAVKTIALPNRRIIKTAVGMAEVFQL